MPRETTPGSQNTNILSGSRGAALRFAARSDMVEPTTMVREAWVGDRYLLCSDGLSGPTSFGTISTTLAEGTPDEAADRLVELALRSGGSTYGITE